MEHTYWQKQLPSKPLFPDIEWSRPEQVSQRGKLGIIGGNSLGFAAVAENYSLSLEAGAGQVRVLLPDVLKKAVPPTLLDVIFGASNPSGGLSKEALPSMQALGAWSDGVLMIGDAGRNSETAIAYEEFLHTYSGPLTITRDAVDLIKNNSTLLVERPNTVIVMSFAQLQKIFRSNYYPIILTFSMQLSNLVEALHKFTITYPATMVVLHNDHIVVAESGKVTTTPIDNAMKIWRGKTATIATCYWLWNPKKPLESTTASLLPEK